MCRVLSSRAALTGQTRRRNGQKGSLKQKVAEVAVRGAGWSVLITCPTGARGSILITCPAGAGGAARGVARRPPPHLPQARPPPVLGPGESPSEAYSILLGIQPIKEFFFGTIFETMLTKTPKYSHHSHHFGRARCGAGAGCSATTYQSLSLLCPCCPYALC